MGLCKCVKKKVTNQFCFEHRVNVCEDCMVAEHPTCVVQGYLQWLNDSDYNPVCKICDDQLATAECIRLVCYDVFHIECLNDWASRFPPNTAPAGYKCLVCSSPVFPAPNLVSPIADKLREVLAVFPWARIGLGLPLIGDTENSEIKSDWTIVNGDIPTESVDNTEEIAPIIEKPTLSQVNRSTTSAATKYSESLSQSQVNSVVHDNALSGSITSSSGVRITATEDPHLSKSQFRGETPHSSTNSVPETRLLLDDKDDEVNKYKRRSALEWFSRWWRTMSRPSTRHHQSLLGGTRRMIVILVLLAIITLIAVFAYFGRGASDDDPLLDPFNNPNIRIESDE